ncbi:MAG: hypothetical protein GC136_08930 [Alphaproteobacteria bacterium]|nr:hypothetical protein [Alphaproteobacteria bacterium]
MVYLIGILGFIGGFAAGMWLLAAKLKNVPRDILVRDKEYHKKYGIWPWIMALLCCFAALYLYNYYLTTGDF